MASLHLLRHHSSPAGYCHTALVLAPDRRFVTPCYFPVCRAALVLVLRIEAEDLQLVVCRSEMCVLSCAVAVATVVVGIASRDYCPCSEHRFDAHRGLGLRFVRNHCSLVAVDLLCHSHWTFEGVLLVVRPVVQTPVLGLRCGEGVEMPRVEVYHQLRCDLLDAHWMFLVCCWTHRCQRLGQRIDGSFLASRGWCVRAVEHQGVLRRFADDHGNQVAAFHAEQLRLQNLRKLAAH